MKNITIVLKNKDRLLANANVVIETELGEITLKGFQVWKSNFSDQNLHDKINITPPSMYIHGKAIYTIFFENKEMWRSLQKDIYDEYMKKLDSQQNLQNLEEIDPDSIPL